MLIEKLINDIEQNLFLPKDLISIQTNENPISNADTPLEEQYSYKIKYDIVADASVLTCGCCISNSLYFQISNKLNSNLIKCPTCDSCNAKLIGAINPLRNLYHQLENYKSQLRSDSTDTQLMKTSSFPHTDHHSLDTEGSTPPLPIEYPSSYYSEKGYIPSETTKKSLISLFHSIATEYNSDSLGFTNNNGGITNVSKNDLQSDINEKSYSQQERKLQKGGNDLPVLDTVSVTKTVPISQDNKSSTISITTKTVEQKLNKNNNGNNNHTIEKVSSNTTPLANDTKSIQEKNLQSTTFDEQKEYYFAKCFPMYRKKSQYATHSKFLKTKSKLFINTAISPDCTKFALITEHKWEVYAIENENNITVSPTLLFCGKSNGQFGPNFDKLQYPDDKSLLLDTRNNDTPPSNTKKKNKGDWEQFCCKLSNHFLVISGSHNIFRVFNLNKNGELIYSHQSVFPIRCIDIDPSSKIIACGITGKEKHSGSEQALIAFHRIEKNKVTLEPEFLSPMTIILPYRDPVKTVQLSNDGLYLSCSTALESRFLIISLKKINEPRLIMKSLRSIDTSLESEGITDTKLFPGNPNLMCVTSTAFKSPPIIINTKIENIDGIRNVAQPTLLIRLNKLGSKIHKCEVSPRSDAIAFLDRNGSVYIMSAPTMLEDEKKRIVLVEMVSNAYKAHESASLKFSPDGHKLYILDRKGILYVEDFAYGSPDNREITKCKQLD
ncbi:Ptr3p NDAI_0B04620 [Naumovozyma dairenensis CBS 421]|uniref:SPS-sensor component PTR3 n=1 Tax=Naumovozyma dairenensis (strain ATCC 10597 / BCRC 20456 / CBS 421 / NBRC 0211 / NRRL Y-12639) TaxID=1071378 RepID=G0W6T6_NAUDC|nr:hypothetical protein NDAI_0B04620 [Naumovozyma dairenensis CBS 421]CCD23497.1 hypothetical protein NDAI_0B04620 [Naumovozyma dairenensis CBS 421]